MAIQGEKGRPLLPPGAGSRGQLRPERAEERPPVARRLQSCKVNTSTTSTSAASRGWLPTLHRCINQPGCSLPVRSVKVTREELQFNAEKALPHLNHHSKHRMKGNE
ncbi:uncharacterized protein ACIB01_016332 isoform 1-T1 [Guaruba guarouba]